jgi:uncharacterized protein (TIGR02246 family)
MNRDPRRFSLQFVGCIGIALLVSAISADEPGKPPSKEEVAKLFDKWNAALQSGKADEVVKLYAADAILLPTVSNKIRRNHAEIKQYFEHFLNYKPVGKINEQHIRIYKPLAINSGLYTFTLTKQGKKTDVRARYTFVYRKQGDHWLIVEHHSSAMPEGSKTTEEK